MLNGQCKNLFRWAGPISRDQIFLSKLNKKKKMMVTLLISAGKNLSQSGSGAKAVTRRVSSKKLKHRGTLEPPPLPCEDQHDHRLNPYDYHIQKIYIYI